MKRFAVLMRRCRIAIRHDFENQHSFLSFVPLLGSGRCLTTTASVQRMWPLNSQRTLARRARQKKLTDEKLAKINEAGFACCCWVRLEVATLSRHCTSLDQLQPLPVKLLSEGFLVS